MSLNEPLALKETNVSQPRLSNSNSKQSLTASEDYYSLSEYNSSSSGDDKPQKTATRYSTPPSRLRSPEDKDELLREQKAERLVKPRHSRTQESLHTIPPSVRFEQQPHHVRRKPVASSTFEEKRKSMDPYGEPITTPGVDDTPYIRFAIDQLTRDEEIRGTRAFPQSSAGGASGSTTARNTQEDYPVETGIHDEGLGYMEQQKAASAGTGFPAPASVPARHPQHTAKRQSRPEALHPHPPPPPPGSPDVFVPFRSPYDSPAFPPLRFLPGILRPLWLGLFIFITLLMLIGLLFCAIWSDTHHGLWDYRNFGDGRYFVFEYLPIMFGMIILIWLFEIEGAVTRIAPFIGLSSNSTRARSNAVFLDLHPNQFLLPRIEYFRSGQPIIGACFLGFWLFLFTIPLLASSFNAQFFGPTDTGRWRWVAVQGVIWTCIALYIIFIAALILLAVHIWRATTGLKWDPRSLADIIALLERSNIMSDYAGTETFLKTLEFRHRLWNRTDRLGYWHTTRHPRDIFYGIGEEGGATRVYSIEGGRIKEKAPALPKSTAVPAHPGDPELGQELTHQRPYSGNGAGGVYSIRADIRAPSTRRRYLPWFLRDGALVAWTLVAFILLLAFLIVSFVNNSLHDGFSPAIQAGSNSAGFSAANFLYSFIPSLIAMLLYLFWQPIDFAYRRLEPFANLSDVDGATAEQSILLDYPATFPVTVTLKALFNRHWTLAFISFMTLVNTVLPILASGMFWAQFYTTNSSVRVAASPPALYALCFFLALYAASFFVLYKGRNRRALPHEARNLAQVISWIYMSRLIGDRAFARCGTKAELVTRLVGAQVPMRDVGFLASVTSLLGRNGGGRTRPDEKPYGPPGTRTAGGMHHITVPGEVRYGFGVYVGRDGREHLGIDRVRREGAADMVLFHDSKGTKRWGLRR